MANVLNRPRWSPYAVGAGIGVLSWITFGLMDKALGTSTTFVVVVANIENLFAPEHVANTAYLAKHVKFDWQFMLVIGLVFGALISSKLSGSYKVEKVPELWAWRFGPSKLKRNLGAFVGGTLLLFGARMANGCTSGHGISGSLQFALSSWVFFASFFMVGIAAAFGLYGGKGRYHVSG